MPSPEHASDNDLDARRMKKRAHDRRAQRAARERTRNRIAQLEATVTALSHEGFDDRSAHLMEQLDTVVKDRDELAGILSVVEASMQKYNARRILPLMQNKDNDVMHETLNLQMTQQVSREHWHKDSSLDATALNFGEEQSFAIDEFNERCDCSATCQVDTTTEQLGDSQPSQTNILPTELLESIDSVVGPSISRELILPCSESPCDCSPYSPVITAAPVEHGNIWRAANAVLSEPIHLSEVILHYEDAMSEDLSVRVIVEGWEEVERTTQLPPLWKKLRKIDQLQFGRCSETIRLAVLSTMHLLLRFYANSATDESTKLPPWLHQR
ncbi:hypothetical protein B0J11DRAFT_619442 [Dendryphion nanum]|uniref:BZIP domain-containing protein n=1 Tax=Dendryphion nanum TaxID=256645 RepID=A0A9P9IBB8_9PLEO|nr:hypothetical protein B0J11DRAFT_619442 [Dendryphion nanum]